MAYQVIELIIDLFYLSFKRYGTKVLQCSLTDFFPLLSKTFYFHIWYIF